MGTFYRWSQPAWLNAATITPETATATAQPNGHNYYFLNVNNGGSSPGAPSGVQVTEGSNQYTFLVGAGEDATALAVNRGLRALAANTDLLDEIVNEDRVRATRIFISVDPESAFVTLPADVYLGPLGDPTTVDLLQNLFRLTNEEGDEILVGGATVTVQGCSEATSPGYSAGGETLEFSTDIPVGDYYLLCYGKTRLSYLGEDLWQHPILASQVRIPGRILEVIEALRGDGLSWDATPPNTLRTLSRRGLNGVYGNGTSVGGMPSLIFPYNGTASADDSPGAGGYFTRTGPAMAGLSQNALTSGTPLKDPLGAIWLGYVDDLTPGTGAAAFSFLAASRSFVSVTPGPRSTNAGTLSKPPALAHFAGYAEHRDTYSSETYLRTKITPGAAATVQRVLGEDYVTLDTGGDDWFSKSISGVDRTAMVVGLTLVELSWANPSDPVTTSAARRVYRVQEIVASNQIKVMGLDGSPVDFPASLTAATIQRVLTPSFVAPAGAAEVQQFKGNAYATTMERGAFMALALPLVSTEIADAVGSVEAYVGARDDSSSSYALAWGGYQSNLAGTSPGQYRRLGFLRGDGSIAPANISAPLGTITSLTSTTATLVTANITTATVATGTITTLTATLASISNATLTYVLLQKVQKDSGSVGSFSGTVAVNVTSIINGKQIAKVVFSGAGASITTITLPTFGVGTVYEVWFDHQAAVGQIASYSTTWPTSAKFRSEADKLLTAEVGWIDIYEFTVVEVGVLEVNVRRIKVA